MWFFQMALKQAKCDPNGINIKRAIFSKAFFTIAQRLGALPPDPYSLLRLVTLPPNPPLRHVLFTLVSSSRFPI